MNRDEMQIGKSFGSAAFFIYLVIKRKPRATTVDIITGTGITERQIKTHIKTLLECGIIRRERIFFNPGNGFIYSSNNEMRETWKLQ